MTDKFMAKKIIQVLLSITVLIHLTACSIVSQSISQATSQTNLKPSNKHLTPTTSMVIRAQLNATDSQYIAAANVGDVGQISITEQRIDIHVLDIYNAANGHLCKKVKVVASTIYPEQELAVCTLDQKKWELTRSIMSNVTF
jgi:hypothetical protein